MFPVSVYLLTKEKNPYKLGQLSTVNWFVFLVLGFKKVSQLLK